jgi:hypothetical protein
MSVSRFLSSTSLLIAAAGASSGTGCGSSDGGSCGPGDAPDAGLVASGSPVALTYGHLSGGLNNDCPAAGAPTGVVSMSIMGMQTDAGGGGLFTLCIGRPDQLATQALGLGFDTTAAVRVVDLSGTADGCTFDIDHSQLPTGTASTTGLCDNGRNAAGFALTLDATLMLTRMCGSTNDSVPVTLRGRAAVAGPK